MGRRVIFCPFLGVWIRAQSGIVIAVAETVVLSSYADLLARARRAFGDDPSYAIMMAQQAHIVRARQNVALPTLLLSRTPSPRLPQD